MFATSSRLRRHGEASQLRGVTQEAAGPPPPGTDSCFGVRSLEGSVEWVGEGGERDDEREGEAEAVDVEDPGLIDGEELPPKGVNPGSGGEGGIPEDTSMKGDETSSPPINQPEAHFELSTLSGKASELSPVETISPRTIRQPLPTPIRVPSPALFLPVLSTSATPSTSHSPPADLDSPPAISDYSTDADGIDTDTDEENHSAPPSPTSLHSFPSYLASEMSMSMPSSPGMGYSTDPGSTGYESGLSHTRDGVGAVLQALERERARSGRRTSDDQDLDLVIPMLSLPSSSLHLSLRPYVGRVEGLKIALVGDMGDTKAFLRALGEKEELVDVGRAMGGGVGVMRMGKLEMVLMPGWSMGQIRQRVITTYSALHSLLNPASAKGDQSKLREMVARYADREEWVHACLRVGDMETGLDISPLDRLIYTIPIQAPAIRSEQEAPSLVAESPTHARMDDPTPLARVESSSYFTHPLSGNTPMSPVPELSPTPQFSPIIHSLQSVMDSNTIREMSIDNFLAWRPAPLDSSQSSLDTPSVGTGTSGTMGMESQVKVQPMPTVAKAKGGGEWEAGLSRRMAKRREGGGVDDLTLGSGSGISQVDTEGMQPGKLRRRSKGSARPRGLSASTPLFPPSTTARPLPISRRPSDRGDISEPGVGLGVKALWERTFMPLRTGMRGWKRVLVYAAIVGVVGWGWWLGAGRQVFV